MSVRTDPILERGLPASPETEAAILGAILLNNSLIESASTLLSIKDFHLESNQLLFAAMLSINKEGLPIDHITLSDTLRRKGVFEKVGGASYIASLIDGVPRTDTIGYYAKIIKESAAIRRLMAVLEGALIRLFDSEDLTSVLDQLNENISRINSSIEEEAPTLKALCLADVEPEFVSWLWCPYIPLGKVTLVEGDPGVGKSWLTCAIATGVAAGCGLPFMEPNEPRSVLILSAEDGLRDTIRPRLDSMRAEVSRIFSVEGAMCFDAAGLLQLQAYILEHRPALVTIDPLVAYLGAGVDLHRANETRVIMAELARIAERSHCAILAVRHLTKSGKDRAIYRGLGSIDFTAACRSELIVGCDPDDPKRRAMVQIKSNLAEMGSAVGYQIQDGGFAWTGASDLTSNRILGASSGDNERTVLGDAQDFLRAALSDGPRPATEVEKEASQASISPRTLKRAKATLGVEAYRVGTPGKRGGGVWYWRLPDYECQEDISDTLNQTSEAETTQNVQAAKVNNLDLEGQALGGQKKYNPFGFLYSDKGER